MCLAIPGKIIEIPPAADPVMQMAKVSFEGLIKDVNISMVPGVSVDDYVLVHVGVAISVVDETEAKRTLDYLKEAGDMDDLKPPEGPEA